MPRRRNVVGIFRRRLFQNKPRRSNLIGLFGRSRFAEVDAALNILEHQKLIQKTDQDRYVLLKKQLTFEYDGSHDISIPFIEMIQLSLKAADKAVREYHDERDRSHFETGVISVSKADLPKVMRTLKKKLLSLQADMENTPADSLVRFNVQIFPIS